MLRQLLRFWLFSIFGMFFAAGATVDAGAGGGADGGNVGADTSDAGEGAAADNLDEGGGADRGSVGEDDLEADATAGGEDHQDPDAPVDLGDGRQVPGKWKKLFDAAQKAGLGKEAKQLYFAQQRLQKAIPGGINAAIQLAKDVEELGGIDGVQELQSELATYRDDSKAFESGDRSYTEAAFQENPDAARQHVVHALNYMSEHQAEHFDHLVAKYIVADLDSRSGLPIRDIHRLLAAQKDNPEAVKLAKAVADYYNSRAEVADKAPEKKVDAQSKALTEKEKTLQKQEISLREADARTQIKPTLNDQIGGAIRGEAKRRGLDLKKLSEEYRSEYIDLVSKIHDGLNKAAMKDSRFLRNFQAHLHKGEVQKAVTLVNKKHEDLIADIARECFERSGVFRGKKKAAAGADDNKGGNQGGNANQNAGWMRVSKRPENSAIDWKKTTTALQVDGKYILRDGKKVVVQY